MPRLILVNMPLTLASGGVFGLIFVLLKIPNGLRIGAMLGSALLSIFFGSAFALNDVRGFKFLALPIVMILSGYIVNCFVTGKILCRCCGYNRKEGMLITTPAGASDIALSSADIGVENTSIIVIQIFRALIAMALFPQLVNLLVMLFG